MGNRGQRFTSRATVEMLSEEGRGTGGGDGRVCMVTSSYGHPYLNSVGSGPRSGLRHLNCLLNQRSGLDTLPLLEGFDTVVFLCYILWMLRR